MESTRTLVVESSERTKTSSLADATSCISQAVSTDCIKILEAVEFCHGKSIPRLKKRGFYH